MEPGRQDTFNNLAACKLAGQCHRAVLGVSVCQLTMTYATSYGCTLRNRRRRLIEESRGWFEVVSLYSSWKTRVGRRPEICGI